jgi:hypothetical protein
MKILTNISRFLLGVIFAVFDLNGFLQARLGSTSSLTNRQSELASYKLA